MAVKFLIGEYRVLWEVSTRHQAALEREPAATEDEDTQLLVDDKLQKIEDIAQEHLHGGEDRSGHRPVVTFVVAASNRKSSLFIG